MSEVNSESGQMSEEVVFASIDDFFDGIKHSTIQFMHPSIKDFIENYTKINKGCSCGKKKRINITKQSYASMVPQIINNVDIEVEMTRLFQSYRIVFKDGEQELGYFGTPRDT